MKLNKEEISKGLTLLGVTELAAKRNVSLAEFQATLNALKSQARKGLKRFAKTHHPDKNPPAEEVGLFKLASNVNDWIQNLQAPQALPQQRVQPFYGTSASTSTTFVSYGFYHQVFIRFY